MSRAARLHRETFGRTPAFELFAPGRVNLIGEHIDYSGGPVLPMAIELGIALACSPREDGRVEIVAGNLGDARDGFAVDEALSPVGDWRDLPRGVASAFRQAEGVLPGLSIAVAGDLPRGAGLSSSAAFGVGLARALADAAGTALPPMALARMAQAAEGAFLGTDCGIMDPLAIAAGSGGHALLIDCREQTVAPIAWPQEWAVLVVDSGVRRELKGSGYNALPARAKKAAERRDLPDLGSLGESDLADAERALAPELAAMARHTVREAARVRMAVESIARRDLAALGELLRASHASLRDECGVSLPPIDALVGLQNSFLGDEGGARLTGGGFGGCAVAILQAERVDALTEHLHAAYRTPGGAPPWTYRASPSPGIRMVAR